MGLGLGNPGLAESSEPQPAADTASFAATGSGDTAGIEKINISHLQRVHVSAMHFSVQP